MGTGNQEFIVKQCKDCGGSGKGTLPGTRCSSCGGSGQAVTLVHRR